MAVNLINVGQIANDGTGDDLREAMIKINENFEILDLTIGATSTASNLGTVGQGLFSASINDELQFKKLNSGTGIALSSDFEKVTVSNTGVVSLAITTDGGATLLEGSAALTIQGGPGISTRIVDGNLVINNTYLAELSQDITPELGGNLNAGGYDILNVGNLTGLVNGVDPAAYAVYFENIELGGILFSVTNTIELLTATSDFDLGTFTNPSAISIDEGVI